MRCSLFAQNATKGKGIAVQVVGKMPDGNNGEPPAGATSKVQKAVLIIATASAPIGYAREQSVIGPKRRP